MGGGHQRAVWEQQGVHWFRLLAFKNLTIGLIWLVTRGGEAWGGWAREAGKGGEMGGGTREQCGQQGVHWFHFLLSFGVEGVGQGGGQGGGDGGEQCGSNKACTGSTFWAPLKTIGLIWLVTRRVGQGGGQGGEMGAAERWEVKWRGLARCGGL